MINDDARNYVFSNVFEVASRAKPYGKVAVGKNVQYVIGSSVPRGLRLARAGPREKFL
ncbi:MAG: hypothetical protein ABW298_07305 [Candidatus Binatia bacterium]